LLHFKEPIPMADEDEDLYDDEFDFVDDLDEGEDEDFEESDVDGASAPEPAEPEVAERDNREEPEAVEEEDPYATPPPAANYVVHIYEHRQFKRTIDRPFTGEDAEAFASEYNRTAKPYGRFAIAGKNDAKPHKSLDDR
jgi:hypothetical protein